MNRISALKRYLIPFVAVFLLFSLSIILWPEDKGHSQQPPSPPPAPVPLIPSVLEDIRNTRHNLSSVGPAGRAVFTEQTTEICVFCHTPHGAVSDEEAAGLNAPLWNRRLSTARYILYDQVWSTSFEGYETKPKPNAPTGYSRLCLSCHDGTIALGTVVNPPGSGVPASWNLYSPGTMPPGSGVTTGDTRVIGTNLQNDHPVSFVYDSSLALRDEELVDPGPPLVPPAKVSDITPISPLRRHPGTDINVYDSVQCTSCHNPHAAKFSDGTTVPKFLRANYYNEPENPARGKVICLYCHDKPGWTGSSHDAATFIPYKEVGGHPTSANPYNYDGTHSVGQYACRACHDPHTAQGAKRLLREGVDFSNNLAIENTCYLCHRPAYEMGNPANPPPDIRSEFYKDANLGRGGSGSAMNVSAFQGHEPVFVSRPQEGVELWSPAPPPFNEYPPGSSIQDTSHIECVDCHNPHQVTKTNRLKGMKGIDINGNVVGAKIPGNSREPYVYEVCLRCHGDSYTNLFVGDRFPEDANETRTAGSSSFPITYRSDPRGGTPLNGNQYSMKGYSNKRKEFDPNTADTAADHTQLPANPAYHPVAAPGRNGTLAICNQLALAFNLKSSLTNPGGTVGNCDTDPSGTLRNITIQCTDCHNNNAFENVVRGPVTGRPDGTSYRRTTDLPAAPNPAYNSLMQSYSDNPSTPQGPHGSDYVRVLRAYYNTDIRNESRCYNRSNPPGCTGSDGASPSFWNNFTLCFQCHDQRSFDPNVGNAMNSMGEKNWTNFVGKPDTGGTFWEGNLHKFHLRYTGAYCHECHYNVHSNVEAQNTLYGNGARGDLPDDSEDGITDGINGTHLINFGPTVYGKDFAKPRWYRDPSTGAIGCSLVCHNVDMQSCYYRAPGSMPQCGAGKCNF